MYYVLTINNKICRSADSIKYVYKTFTEAQQEAVYLSKEHIGDKIDIKAMKIEVTNVYA